jgi:hypothetical protein
MPFIGNQPTQGRFIELDSLSASATDEYTLKLNTANYSPESVNNLLVSINGIIQGSSTMSLNGAVLTVGAVLSSSDTIDFVRVLGNVGTVSTPTDGSVTANKIGTGAVTSAKIADGTIVNADINASAGIAGSKLGTGAILQVKYFQLTTSQTETYPTTNTDQAITNFVVNITPKSTSSIMKIEANIMYEWANDPWDTMWFFYRDTTKLGNTQASAGSRRIGISPSVSSHGNTATRNSDSTPEFATLTYFDDPQTTSAINYKLGVNANGTSDIFINRTVADTDAIDFERGLSFISVTEIGG